jgi:small-conductance mechanosensitive channel
MADGQSIIIPNGDLLSQQLVNWSMGKGHKKITLLIGIAYGSNIEKAILILAGEKGILQNPPALFVPLAFGPNAIEIKVSFIIFNFREASSIRGRVIFEINNRFKQEGIDIPLLQQAIRLRSLARTEDHNKKKETEEGDSQTA